MKIKDYMEAVNYKISEGGTYGWRCYGDNAYWLSSPDYSETDRYNISLTFDTVDQTVYCVEVSDYDNNRAYRWMNPDYVEAYKEEAKNRGIDPNEAWDDVKSINLESEQDLWEKVNAIINGQEYDTRVLVQIEMDEDLMHQAMVLAHDMDITFNEFIENAIQTYIADHEHLKDWQ